MTNQIDAFQSISKPSSGLGVGWVEVLCSALLLIQGAARRANPTSGDSLQCVQFY